MHTQEFINACYNLIDLKIIDLDEYQGFLDNFTTTEELDAYLTAREDISFSQTMHEIADLIFDSWYLAGAEFLTLCPKSDKIRDSTETAVWAVRCYYARGATPYIKTLNYPNLQRWQFASDI